MAKYLTRNHLNCKVASFCLTVCYFLIASAHISAATWSNTEVQLQHGKLANPFPSSGQDPEPTTSTITFQHASGWDYGSNFFFFDYDSNKYNDVNYGEWYSTFSSKKIFNAKYGGPIRDIGFVMGVNAASEVNKIKYLPGARLDWNIPGFTFFNTMLTAYMGDGRADTNNVKETDSWMLDIAWQLPFSIGPALFSFEGHAEYIGQRDQKTNGVVTGTSEAWILAQPQLRWDMGKTFFNKKDTLFMGMEYQYWKNKLGSKVTESHPRFLLVWRL